MRLLSFALFVTAAFDWPLPWLDRAGVAALALGFLALGVGASLTGARRSLPFGLPTTTAAVGDDVEGVTRDLVARLSAYSEADG